MHRFQRFPDRPEQLLGLRGTMVPQVLRDGYLVRERSVFLTGSINRWSTEGVLRLQHWSSFSVLWLFDRQKHSALTATDESRSATAVTELWLVQTESPIPRRVYLVKFCLRYTMWLRRF